MNPNTNLFVIDDQNPEDIAMMQALYSRSAESVMVHVEKVKKSGSGKFMESFYVGYGHESIGDCGSTTVFIENVSMLAAKAIQDWPLYSGQETSTRYIDMSKQALEDPVGTEASAQILKKWMEFYISKLEPVATHLKTIYPRKPDEKESVYEKAIKARAFDSLRCFLPAGVTTQLAWHTNLRQAARKLALLNHHPDARIRELSQAIHSKLAERYASSFSHKSYEATEAYRASMAAEYTYFSPNDCPQDVVCKTSITPADIAPYMNAIKSRPAKTELPQFMLDLGLVTFEFQMDFGSFRDIQRHRNGVCRMPLLTTQFGFHPWYLDQLPTDIRAEAEALIAEQTQAISTLETSDINKQYYVGMGFRVPCRVSYGLPAALYTLELRSGKTVHPTLRRIAQQMAKTLQEKLPDLTIHADMDIDDWDVRRGLQDITHKPTV
jgi:thymidylate synthase ThyX